MEEKLKPIIGRIVKKVALVSGVGEGTTKLMAFDNALQKAGIHNVNLIEVSSIIPPHARIVDWNFHRKPLPVGSFVPVLLSKIISDKVGEKIIVSIAACKTPDELGISTEYHAVNTSRKEAESVCKKMLEDMSKRRRVKIINPIQFKCAEHVVKECGCTLVGLVYF